MHLLVFRSCESTISVVLYTDPGVIVYEYRVLCSGVVVIDCSRVHLVYEVKKATKRRKF